MYTNRLWVPSSLHTKMLTRLHEAHFGITKTIALANASIWWPRINEDIEETVKNSQKCASERPNRSEPLITTPLPDAAWKKIGADLMKHEWYLVVMDYYSKYLEIMQLPSLTSKVIINKLESLFARFGIPETFFTDNGTQLTSEEMRKFAATADFEIVTRSPAYPKKTAKQRLRYRFPKKSLGPKPLGYH